jgi:hypothetical protein
VDDTISSSSVMSYMGTLIVTSIHVELGTCIPDSTPPLSGRAGQDKGRLKHRAWHGMAYNAGGKHVGMGVVKGNE